VSTEPRSSGLGIARSPNVLYTGLWLAPHTSRRTPPDNLCHVRPTALSRCHRPATLPRPHTHFTHQTNQADRERSGRRRGE
jgi:hypothetical protein